MNKNVQKDGVRRKTKIYPNYDIEERSDSDTASESTLREDKAYYSDSESLTSAQSIENSNYVADRNSEAHQENFWRREDEPLDSRESLKEEAAGSVGQIKDLLARLSPMISMSGTSDTTAEILMFLSDTDPNFHTLQLVKSIRKDARLQLEEPVKTLANNYTAQNSSGLRNENPVVSILNSLFHENSFTKFMEDFQSNLMSSCDQLHQNFDEEMSSVMFQYFMGSNSNVDNSRSSTPSNGSSLNSSLNQSGFLFLTPMQYSSISSALLTKHISDSWLDYLNQLLAVTPGEPVIQGCWSDLKSALQNCILISILKDSVLDNEVLDKTLKIHAKLVASQSQSACTEANLNLIDTALEFWRSKKFLRIIPKNTMVIDFKQSIRLLKILKLLIQFQMDLTNAWIRYPDHLSVVLVEKWLDFLTSKSERQDHLTCFDLISILDTDAQWLKQWVHGRYGRSKVIKSLTENPYLIRLCMINCTTFINNATKYENTNPVTPNSERFMSNEQFQKLKFLHSFSFLLEIFKYQEGRDILPFTGNIEEKRLTCDKFFNMVYRYIEKDQYSITYVIRTKLKKFCTSCENVTSLLCKSGLPQLYTKRLLSNRHEIHKKSILIQLETINALLLNESSGYRNLLLGDSENGVSSLMSTVECDSLLKLLARLTLEEHESSAIHAVAFSMCVSVLKYPYGRYLYADHWAFHQTLVNLSSLNEERFLGILAAICDNSIEIEHHQSLLRETAALALENGQLDGKNPELSAHIIAIMMATEIGAACIDRVLEEDSSLIWPQQPDEPANLPLPIIALTSSYNGVELLLKHGMRFIAGAIFSDLKFAERETGLTLLAAAAASIEGKILLQHRLGYKEELMKQQYTEEGEAMVDECFLLRYHLITKAVNLGTEHISIPLVPPQRNDDVAQFADGDKVSSKSASLHKRPAVSGLRQFMQGFKISVHDQTWLTHCRKHFAAALLTGDTIKNSYVMDIVETALEVMYPAVSSMLVETDEMSDASPQHSTEDVDMTNYALDLAQKYCGQHELLSTPSRWNHSKVLNILQRTSAMEGSKLKANWYAILVYIFCDGDSERVHQLLPKLSCTPTAMMMWPSRGASKRVVRLTQIILSLHEINTYNALQHYSSGCIWSLLEGWLDSCWLGVISWSEIVNWFILISLRGPDFSVYFTVAFLRCKLSQFYRGVNNVHSSSDWLLALKCDECNNWRLSEHLSDVMEMSKRHRRLVNSLIGKMDS